jgi:hypothetical protein
MSEAKTKAWKKRIAETNDTYRENYDRIFKKPKKDTKIK